MEHSHAMQPESVLENVGWVRSLALQLAGHTISADDVAQETWIRVLRNPPPEGVSFRKWTAGTMRNVVLERSRQSHRRRERESRVARERKREHELEIRHQVAIERDVVQQVMQLDEPYRNVVLARYFEHKEIAEIASIEQVSVSAIKSRLMRAYAKLRARMVEQPDSPAGAFLCMAIGKSSKIAATAMAGEAGAFTAVKATLVGAGWRNHRFPDRCTHQPRSGGNDRSAT